MNATFQHDLYLEEIIPRLERSKIYNRLIEIRNQGHDHGVQAFITLVNETVSYCYQRSKMVMKYMGEFTLHDGEHLFRVLRLMEQLIPQETFHQLSVPELGLLVMAAFFHDVGMAPSGDEVRSWLGLWEDGSPNEFEQEEYQKYVRFKISKQNQVLEINQLRIAGKHAQADILERYLVTEFIRVTHADRAIDVIEKDWNGKIKYKDVDLTAELAQLCQSHNYDSLKLMELESSMIVGQDMYLCLPFIGVLLRLGDVLDFDGNRTPSVLFAHLGVKDPVSIREWQKHRAVEAWTISPVKIIFNATCTHPAIEYSIKEFCDYIDYELVSCSSILNNLHDSIRNPFPSYYKISLPRSVDRSQIVPKKDVKGNAIYIYRDTKFTLNKEQIIDILMGTKLYGQPNVALRELVQNSIDACKLRLKMEESWGQKGYTPEIEIRFIKEGLNTYLEINDNGVGMDQYIIDNYYSKVGSSYYASSDFLDLKSTLTSTFIPTSRFGIGVLSCFMVSENIEVETKRIYEAHDSSQPINLSIVGQESIFYIKQGTRKSPGTSTRLLLKQGNPWTSVPDENLINYVKATIPFPPCNVRIVTPSTEVVYSTPTTDKVSLLFHNENTWSPHINFKNVRLEFDGSKGIYGACEVGLLEEAGIPVKNVKQVSKPLFVEGKELIITTEILLDTNQYKKNSQTIVPESIGNGIRTTPSMSTSRESRSKLALHGVEIPMSLFSHWMGQIYQYAKVQWPICIRLNVNIDGEMDINLNSARTEILLDEKFRLFELKMASLICEGLKANLTAEYWSGLKPIIMDNIKNGPESPFAKALSTL